MEAPTILPSAPGVSVKGISSSGTAIVIEMEAIAPRSCCPACKQYSSRVHSRYRRTLADLPWNRVSVYVRLSARKFFCDRPDCSKRIFAERVPELAERYSRRTLRLQGVLYILGYALGGEAGAALAKSLGIAVSPDTLLNRLRRCSAGPLPAEPVRVLGVDDFAIRRGHIYGTILVDLERRRVLDLLPDRTAERLATWLESHPGVEVISRDRASAYADAANTSAPGAVQVADRFHLLRNASDALDRLLARQRSPISEAVRRMTTRESSPASALVMTTEEQAAQNAPVRMRKRERRAQGRERREARYKLVLELHATGLSRNAVAEQVGLTRTTVARYLKRRAPPNHVNGPHACVNRLAPFEAYLKHRWEQGCHNATKLLEEIREQGYAGSYCGLVNYVGPWRSQLPKQQKRQRRGHSATRCQKDKSPPSSRLVGLWLLGRLDRSDPERQKWQQGFLQTLCTLCPEISAAQRLLGAFIKMVKKCRQSDLDPWLEEAGLSSVREVMGFAQGIKKDRAAVEAALTSNWSNGPTEGHVNRLKLVKRQMYGRANLDLLRARVLPMARAD